MTRRLMRLALAATLLVTGACQPANLAQSPAGSEAPVAARFALSGVATFGDRATQIAPDALTQLATVTLTDGANRTVAVTRTDAAGAFTLLPASTFVAATGDVFYLDAYKGTRDNAVGADVARLRTVLQWTSGGWKSASGPGIVITPLTTAVSVIHGLAPGSVSAAAILDTVTGASVTTANGTLNAHWSAVLGLVRDLLAKDQDPLARIAYPDGTFRITTNKALPLVIENFRGGTFSETGTDETGRLVLGAPKPSPNDPASRTDYFSCAGVAPDAVGVVVSDGTYLYVKSWIGYGANSPTTQIFKRIGTGYNGTVRGAYHGTIGPTTPVAMSAVYHDGAIYQPIIGDGAKLFRLSTTTGATTSIDLPTPLINRASGLPTSGDYLLTGDGTYFYALAYGIGGNTFNGYTIQVLDPKQGFKQIRSFTMDTASDYIDGVVCDGRYIYPLEWNTPVGQIYRYRLSDGRKDGVWDLTRTGDAAAWNGHGNYRPLNDDPIAGAWDPFNKVFWLGNVGNEKVHLLRGGNFIHAGTWTSAAIDAGAADPFYGRFSWQAELPGAGSRLSFQVRSADTTGALAAATWHGPTGTSDAYTASGLPLNPVHAKHRYLQVRASLDATTDQIKSPTLSRLSVEVMP